MRWISILSALMCISAAALKADSTNTSAANDTVLFVPQPGDRDSTLVIDTTNWERHLYQNPTAALFKSLAVPGLGQVGNHRYVKGMIFAGLEAWFIGASVHYNRQARDFRKQYDASVDTEARIEYYSLYKDRRDERNKYYWFAGITVFVSMFDAYVDAHLSGSPTTGRNRKVGLGVTPDGNGGTAVRVAFRF